MAANDCNEHQCGEDERLDMQEDRATESYESGFPMWVHVHGEQGWLFTIFFPGSGFARFFICFSEWGEEGSLRAAEARRGEGRMKFLFSFEFGGAVCCGTFARLEPRGQLRYQAGAW